MQGTALPLVAPRLARIALLEVVCAVLQAVQRLFGESEEKQSEGQRGQTWEPGLGQDWLEVGVGRLGMRLGWTTNELEVPSQALRDRDEAHGSHWRAGEGRICRGLSSIDTDGRDLRRVAGTVEADRAETEQNWFETAAESLEHWTCSRLDSHTLDLVEGGMVQRRRLFHPSLICSMLYFGLLCGLRWLCVSVSY